MQHRRGKDRIGRLYRNDRQAGPHHPTHRGAILIGGIRYRLDAFVRTTKDGRRYFELVANRDDAPKDDRRTGPDRVLVATCGPPRKAQDGRERSRHPGEAEDIAASVARAGRDWQRPL